MRHALARKTLLRLKREATSGAVYRLRKAQLYALSYGASLRRLHAMAKNARMAGGPR